MIPFDILSGEIITEDKIKTEIRILELSPESFSFRLPLEYLNVHGQIEIINLSFFSWEREKYEDFEAVEFDISPTSNDSFSEIFMIKIIDEKFSCLSKTLTEEYLKYIDLKTNYSNEELSYRLTGFSGNTDDFCSNISEQMEYWSKTLADEQSTVDCPDRFNEFCISLENDELYSLFLNSSAEDFVNRYYKRWELEKHVLTVCRYSRILVGNPYCINLFPDEQVLIDILIKAKLQGMDVTIVLPPVSQTHFNKVCKLLDMILSIYICEIQVNDIGTESYIKEHFPKAVTVHGPFLNKERRDPRKSYSMQYKNRKNSNLMVDEKSVYYPFYQTNTGTFCPLFAAVMKGKRGNQKRVTNCGKTCTCNQFLYPRDLNIIGKYNSLLGFENELSAIKERLVINLW